MNHSLADGAPAARAFSRWWGLAVPLVLLVMAAPTSAQVVISQVYGGGGNSGATLRHDFIELFNKGAAPVNLGGWSVQYTAATGIVWAVSTIAPGKTVAAGGYFLIQQAPGAGGTQNLPTPDEIGLLAMGSTAGKVGLSSNNTALGGAAPSGGTLVDIVSYGPTATATEGTPTPALSNTTAALRNGAGCDDSGNNSVDFSVGAPNPRNSAVAAIVCGGGGGGGSAAIAATIFEIQGSGATSPRVGQNVFTSGVVTHRTSNGFFIQDVAGDGNPLTSDGLFVFTGSGSFAAVVVGNLVRVTGVVAEFSSGVGTAATPLTQIANPSAVDLVGSGQVPGPVAIVLPLAEGDSLERFEGMLVTVTSAMTVQQNFFQARYGQLTLGAGGRHETPTNRFRPGASAQALAAQQARGRLLLDDSNSAQNANPIPYLAVASGLPRAGDTVTSLTGVIDFGLATNVASGAGLYRLQPTVAPMFSATNPRPAAPPAVAGNVSVASMNVLNYFTTFTDGSTATGGTGGCTLGGVTAASNCRGANNLAEFNRQRAKIILALATLNADVVGLMEIQNNVTVAAQNLVDGLNAVLGAGTYAVVADPVAGTGSDAIKLALVYKPARLALVGGAASDTDPVNNRPTLSQTFSPANGERFTVMVNHLKSKGSCPAGAGPDADQGDGQGCWNALRLQQAQRLRTFVAAQQAASGSNDVVVIGDMNAYGQEDPIFELTSNGFVDQLSRYTSLAYSYVFDGAAGRLDHGITTASMSPKVAAALVWHINADEAAIRDYNLEFKAPASTCGAPCPPDPFDAGTAARSSDHDPVLLGLNIYKPVNGTAAGEALTGSPGDDRITGGPGADRLTGGAGADLFVYSSVLDGGDTITDYQPGADKIVLTDLFRSFRRANLANALATGFVTCVAARGGAVISIDTDGAAGPLQPRALALLQGQSCAAVMNAQNFVF